MQQHFVLEYYIQELYIKLQSLRQGGVFVKDNAEEFEMLLNRCELQKSQEKNNCYVLEM